MVRVVEKFWGGFGLHPIAAVVFLWVPVIFHFSIKDLCTTVVAE